MFTTAVSTSAARCRCRCKRGRIWRLYHAEGVNVSEAALEVGYVSASQFSREFKRLYGKSPRQWSDAQHVPIARP